MLFNIFQYICTNSDIFKKKKLLHIDKRIINSYFELYTSKNTLKKVGIRKRDVTKVTNATPQYKPYPRAKLFTRDPLHLHGYKVSLNEERVDSCFSGWKRGKKKSWKKSRLVKEKWKVDNAYLNRSRIDPCKIHSGSKSRTFCTCTRPQSWNRNFLFEPRISLARNCGRRGEGIRRRLARDRSIFSRDGSQEHEK